MKKILILILTLIMVMALAACTGSSNPPAPESTAEPESTIVEPEPESTPEAVSIEGYWQDSWSQRASLYIEKTGDTYSAEITWGNSADSTVSWSMDCTYDEASGILSYENERKVVYTTEGTDTAEDVEFENGTGTLTLKDGIITWQDDQDDSGKECKFELC